MYLPVMYTQQDTHQTLHPISSSSSIWSSASSLSSPFPTGLPIKMSVAYTIIDKDSLGAKVGRSLQHNASSPSQVVPSLIEGATLFVFAILGGLGNVFVMIVTLTCPKFRQMSFAFLFHHCLLDCIKSVFCLPFGYSLLMKNSIPHCDVLGAAYMLLMTVSAYNLLALLLNEEYQCSFAAKNKHQTPGDTCCIVFGIVIIWFTTVLLHLGVAFLPGTSEFSKDIGNCVYRYGVTKNYVIHVLWVVLVTGALTVATFSFVHFYRKLLSGVQSRKWTLLHKSLSSLNNQNHNHHHQHHHHHQHPLNASQDSGEEEVHYQFDDEIQSQEATLHIHKYIRRLVVLFCMLVSFVVCWYPLFLLTLFDPSYRQSAHLYRVLTILAWLQPLTTPVFCAVIYYGGAATPPRGVYPDIYANAIPMTLSKSSHSHTSPTHGEVGEGGEDNNHDDGSDGVLSFHNHNFHWVCSSSTTTNTTTNNSGNLSSSNHHQHHQNHASASFQTKQHKEATSCKTFANYNTEEEEGQTLIM